MRHAILPVWGVYRFGSLVVLLLAVSPIVETTLHTLALAETKYIPDVRLSQRYDSNVFRSPKEFLPPDQQRWDLVSDLATQLKIINKSRLGDTQANVGVNGSVYAYNTNLSYVGVNGLITSNLSNFAHEFLAGLNLRVSDSIQYTPEQPAFLIGGKPEQSDIFARGIQAYRSNFFSNTISATSSYAFSRPMSIRADYQYSVLRVGQIFVTGLAPGVGFYNTTGHSFSTGPEFTFDAGDKLYMRYTYQNFLLVQEGVSTPPINYTAHTIQPEYVSKVLKGWTLTLSGGATLLEQAGARTFFSGRATLRNELDRRTQVTFSASREAAPSFFGTGGGVISNVVQLYISHNFSRVVRLNVSGNYAYNETIPDASFKINSILGYAALEYDLTRSTKLSLSQEYNHLGYTGITPFDRYATMVMVSTEWK